MILDSSVVVAIALQEPRHEELVCKLRSADALEAFRRFGKGRHPAALNFGDCLSYATARIADHPLLFVGDDFSRTDIAAA